MGVWSRCRVDVWRLGFFKNIPLIYYISLVVIQIWHLWARSGHRERSVALFQALMELNLRAPNFPGYFSGQDKLQSFARFWESSVPRFGEINAPGWCNASRVNHVPGKSFDYHFSTVF